MAFDTRLTMSVALDPVGNHRAIVIDIYDADLPQPLHSTVNNQFDAAQRMVMQNSTEDGVPHSLQHVYSQNFLIQEIIDGTLNILTYYDNGLLSKTLWGDHTVISARGYDNAMRESNFDDNSKGTTNTTEYVPNTSAVGAVIQTNNKGDTVQCVFTGFDSRGNPSAQRNDYKPSGDYALINIGRVAGDEPIRSNVDGKLYTRTGPGPLGTASYHVDPNLAPNGTVSSQPQSDNTMQDQTAVILSLPDGRMISKTTIASVPHGRFAGYATRDEPFYNISGNLIGINTTHIGPQGLGFTSGGRKNYSVSAQGGIAYNTQTSLLGKLTDHKKSNLSKTASLPLKFFDPVTRAAKSSFKLSVVAQTINESYPPPSPYFYKVKAGDTYDSIANDKKMYGMGVQISNANGGIALTEVNTIIIPPMLIDNNAPGNYAAYNQFIQDMIPALTPALIAALPPQHHPSFFVRLVKILAAVAILVIAPHLAPFLIAALAGIGLPVAESFAVGIVAGMLDAGIQGIEIAAHMQKDFSFTEVISTALTAGFATNSTEVTDVLKAAAEANVASQLGAMVIGASDKFDFKQLLDTLASAGIAAEINLSNFFSKTNIAAQLGQNTVNAVATAGVNKLVYNQQPNMEDIAAESLGTTFGTETSIRHLYRCRNDVSEARSRRESGMEARAARSIGK
jgi:hypothetical protein